MMQKAHYIHTELYNCSKIFYFYTISIFLYKTISYFLHSTFHYRFLIYIYTTKMVFRFNQTKKHICSFTKKYFYIKN